MLPKLNTLSRILLPVLASLMICSSAVGKLNVVSTTPDFGAIAGAIGGDEISLTTLAKPTEDPHFVDAKPSFIVKLNRADALVEGGDRKSTRLNSSHVALSRMPSS